jgi:hypothetical protein
MDSLPSFLAPMRSRSDDSGRLVGNSEAIPLAGFWGGRSPNLRVRKLHFSNATHYRARYRCVCHLDVEDY